MAKRNIRTNLIGYMTTVLDRYGVAYTVEKKCDEEYSSITSDLSSRAYHRHLERAMCEQESAELHNGRQVISYYEWRNRLYNGRGFHMLKKDNERYLSEVAC